MKAFKSHATKENTKIIKQSGIGLYGLTILVSILLMIVEPSGLDVTKLIMPVILFLFVGALGFSYPIAAKGSDKVMSVIGTVVMATLFAFVGFFVIAAIAWLLALTHV